MSPWNKNYEVSRCIYCHKVGARTYVSGKGKAHRRCIIAEEKDRKWNERINAARDKEIQTKNN